MITNDEKTVTLLNGLIRTVKDSEKGFQSAGDIVKDADLIELFAGYALQRAKFGKELRERVKTLRSTPARDDLPGGALHREWMELRATLESSETHAVLAECERGEDVAVLAYAEALRTADLDVQSREIIQRQYEFVQAAHDRIRQLRDGAKYAHR